MPITFSTRISVETRQGTRPRGGALLAVFVLLAMAVILLWLDRGFAEYTMTGILWDQAQGTVVDATNNSVPTVEFSTPDGATHQFKEDYILLCQGSRRFCFVRSFQLGEQVPVVYNPQRPARAYIHDEALYGSVLGFFVDAILALLLVPMMIIAVRRKPMQATIQFGGDEIEP